VANYFIEVQYDSRKTKLSYETMDQTFVFRLCLDENNLEAEGFEFYGFSDDVVALNLAYSFTPTIRLIPDYFGVIPALILSNLEISQVGPREWEVITKYEFSIQQGKGGQQQQQQQFPNTLPYLKMGFTIGGGTKNIKKSREITSTELSTDSDFVGPPAPPPMNAIGRTENGIEGVDVPSGNFILQITAYYRPSFVTLAFAKTLQRLVRGKFGTGSYNIAPYLGAAAGELAVTKVTGSGTVADIIPITFDFSYEPNINDEVDEGFPNLTALGHDVVDYQFEHVFDENNSKKVILAPYLRYVHRVASPEDYRALELPV